MIQTNKLGYLGKGSVEIGPAAGPGIEIVYIILEYAARTHGTRRALGWHEIVDIHEEEKEVKKISTSLSSRRPCQKSRGVSWGLIEIGVTLDELLPTLYNILQNAVNQVCEPSKTQVSDVIAVRESIQVFSIDKTHQLVKSKSTEPLTARSTGPPKSVVSPMPTLAPVGAVYTRRGHHHLTYDDAYLAHVLECIVELIMPCIGMTSGYGRVKTLTDAPVATFQPSIVVGVPAIWEMIWKRIVAHVNVGALV
ncbi:acetyl-CoA synthetase-like protein [Lentinula edodes]|nr:acetyl-CoA synthetase-like protein [Lentinula edodes]